MAIPDPPIDWAAPVCFALKTDGALRFCVDIRRLYTMKACDAYPILRIKKCIDSLENTKVFSTLDASSNKYQILIAPRDCDNITLNSHFGKYPFMRMPFGPKNALAMYQQAIDIILTTVKCQFALMYFDDIIVFSSSFEDHKAHVRIVLRVTLGRRRETPPV